MTSGTLRQHFLEECFIHSCLQNFLPRCGCLFTFSCPCVSRQWQLSPTPPDWEFPEALGWNRCMFQWPGTVSAEMAWWGAKGEDEGETSSIYCCSQKRNNSYCLKKELRVSHKRLSVNAATRTKTQAFLPIRKASFPQHTKNKTGVLAPVQWVKIPNCSRLDCCREARVRSPAWCSGWKALALLQLHCRLQPLDSTPGPGTHIGCTCGHEMKK